VINKKDILILSLISLILGILFVKQFYISKEVEKLKAGEENQLLALEISKLLKANTDLRLEIQDLSITLEKYQKSLEDKKSAAEELSKNLEKYKIIAGTNKIEGQGVEILISKDLEKEQMVDLVNALKNIGVEGISINGIRLTISSYFTATLNGLFLNSQKLESPYKILVVGNASLIKEALERRGGIIEQIKAGSKEAEIKIEKKDKIILEAAS
jgi:uncharacterized protein YlxW (UPF0749 family)